MHQFEQIDPKATVDPASCLFYRAVCEHELLRKDAGLATIEKLLKNTENVPVAYSTVATLMQHDLEALNEKTLDSIARQMRDSERRRDLLEPEMRKEYDFSKSRKNPYAKALKSQITIRLDTTSVAYFKQLAAELGMPYQNLINLYLRDCAMHKRRPSIEWGSSEKRLGKRA